MPGTHCRKKGCLFLVALFLLLFSGNEAFSQSPLATWTFRSPFIAGSDLYGITYASDVNGHALWVAVGNSGTVTTSADQVNWTSQQLGPDADVFNAVAYAAGPGLFVAVGTKIWTSPDGYAWTYRPSTAGPYGGIAYGNGRFVAGGGQIRHYSDSPVPCTEGGTGCGLATSEDGVTWTDRSNTSGLTSEPTVGLVFADGKFVQVGWHEPPYYSTDGLTWTAGVSGVSLYNHAADMAYGNGLFVVVGDYLDLGYGGTVLLSGDGVTWTRTSGPAFECVCYGNGTFLAAANNNGTPVVYATYTSTDGQTWTSQSNGAYGNRMVASPGSFTLASGSMGIATSPDGVVWTSQTAGLSIEAAAVAYGNSLFATVGSGGNIYVSPDGTTWTGQPNASFVGKNFDSIVYGTNGWVAAGTDATTGVPSVISSANGTAWAQTAQAGSPTRGLAYGNGMYIGLAGSTIYSSPNGTAWTARATDPSGALNGATFGNGKFVVVGDKSILTSSDGISWSSQASGLGYRLVGVAAGNNLFAAVGDDATTITVSSDGLAWSDAASGISSGALNSIAYGSGAFVAIGNGGWVSYSSNGRTWTAQSLGYTGSSWAIAFGNSTFVAVSGNTILQSDPLPASQQTTPTTTANTDATSPSSGGGGGGGGGCFIATAAYGSDFAWEVRAFKEFREKHLLTNRAGRRFVAFYYAVSPPLAAFIAGRPALRGATRLFLEPAAYAVRYPLPWAASCLLFLVAMLVFAGKARKRKREQKV